MCGDISHTNQLSAERDNSKVCATCSYCRPSDGGPRSTLGVSGRSNLQLTQPLIEALKDKLGVTQPRLNTLLQKLHHMAVSASRL
jgi:hypothetical protein